MTGSDLAEGGTFLGVVVRLEGIVLDSLSLLDKGIRLLSYNSITSFKAINSVDLSIIERYFFIAKSSKLSLILLLFSMELSILPRISTTR